MNIKKRIQALVSAIVLVAGIIIAAIGYSLNTDNSITQEDVLVLLGIFLVFASLGILIQAIAALSSNEEEKKISRADQTKRLAYAAMFAALAYIGFQFFRIDIPVGTEKTAFHLGNTFVVLAALFLGGVWGGYAGAVGLTIADLTSGYVTSAPKTFLLKLLIGLIVGFVAHKLFHISKPQPKKKIFIATLVSSIAGLAFNVVADPLVGYFYKTYLYGVPQDLSKALAKISAATTAVNAAASVVMAVILYSALRPALIKANLFFRVESDFDK